MSIRTFLILAIFAFQQQSTIQAQDFPVPFGGRATARPKGPVHTVLTVQQRGDKVFGTTVEVYDLNGKLVESVSNNAGVEIHSGTMVRLGGKSTFTHDASGNPVKRNHFAPESQYTSYETYIYDAQNRLVENIVYSLNGKEFERKSYKYLPGKLELEMSRKIDYGEGKKHLARYLVSFNDKGQRTKWTEYDSKGALVQTSFLSNMMPTGTSRRKNIAASTITHIVIATN